jgi:hypothetical protein
MRITRPLILASALMLIFCACEVLAQSPHPKARGALPAPPCGVSRSAPQPECAIELTCTDKPIQLGYSNGVCFRATCPGIWALLHERADQASFRRRLFTYRHYHFVGYWELKDQGLLESGPIQLRELFLVLPDDLIEFRLAEPDCHARIELRNLGYIKRGTIHELKQWLAHNTFMEMPNLQRLQQRRAASPNRCDDQLSNRWIRWCQGALLPNVFSLGRALLPPLGR